MSIFVDSPLVKKSRENVLELLLINHPLDCPICDQAGECDLQDQTLQFGSDISRFFFSKRSLEDKSCGFVIKTIMTRCIHCTKCVRYNEEISGNSFFGVLNRGSKTEIGSYDSFNYNSEISGNIIDLCPVGALTSKFYSFKTRPWELRLVESIDVSDGLCSPIYINIKESEIVRVFPKLQNEFNNNFISDKARYSFDLNNNNRLKHFIKSDKFQKKLDLVSLQSSSIFNSDSKNLFLTNNSLDLENLFFVKNLENLNSTVLGTKTVSYKENSNLFFCLLKNSISCISNDIKFCFIFSCNVKLENSIINLKLRLKSLKNNLTIFGFLQNFLNNYSFSFVNLNLFLFYRFIEGKSYFLSKFLFNYKNSLIIFGENLIKNGLKVNFIIKYFKNFFPSFKFLFVQNSLNSDGRSLLNVENLFFRYLKRVNFLICLDLEESFFIKKILNNFHFNIIWINSFKTKILSLNLLENRIVYQIPCPTFYEEEKFFINIEHRIQKTSKVFNYLTLFISSIKNSLMKLFNFIYLIDSTLLYFYSLHLSFYKEILKNPSLFSKLKFFKIFSFVYLNQLEKNDIILVLNYPLKTTEEDFFLSNKFIKNSKKMLLLSNANRFNFTNF
jgi:uncharacterized Fe-S cluster protein YjdI